MKHNIEEIIRYGAVAILFLWNVQLQNDINDVKHRLYNCYELRINDHLPSQQINPKVAILVKPTQDEKTYKRYSKK